MPYLKITKLKIKNYLKFFFIAVIFSLVTCIGLFQPASAAEPVKISDKDIEMTMTARDFKMSENPAIEFRDTDGQESDGFLSGIFSFFAGGPEASDPRVELINSRGESKVLEKGKEYTLENSGGLPEIEFVKSENVLPGKNTVKVNFSYGGQDYDFTQDFTWGVLAINVNKTVYAPGEVAKLHMAVLSDWGNMVCNAKLTLDIIDPSGNTQTLSTENGKIIMNGDVCSSHIFTPKPDYETSYQTGADGVYKMTLAAETSSGKRSITDGFQVRSDTPFDVERVSTTRIFPPNKYPVTMNITANEDFKGKIIETVPESFEITEISNNGVIASEAKQSRANNSEIAALPVAPRDDKEIIWEDISLKKGDKLELQYIYDAPDVSPDFYTLGPLEFTESSFVPFLADKIVFSETRAWQIAVDATQTYATGSGNWNSPVTANVTVELWGGGGSGGSGGGTNAYGGGGGAGGQYAIKQVSVTKGSNYAYSVAAGVAGVSGGSGVVNGNPGNDTTFGSSTVVAKGGAAGLDHVTAGNGGDGSISGGIGDTVYAGGSGADGTTSYGGGAGGGAGSTGTGNSASGSTGGSAKANNGGAGGSGSTVNSGNGVDGSTYGGGGGGATKNGVSGAGEGGYIVITYPDNTAPSVAANTGVGATFPSGTPALEFTGTDANYADDIRYNIQICNSGDSSCASPRLDKVSGTDAGFLNTVSGGDTDPFNSGEKISYTVQSGDTLPGGTYYWRVRGIDPGGTNTYGSWTTIQSFVVAVSGISIAGTSNIGVGTTVRVAVNNSLQAQTAIVQGDSSWSILGVTQPSASDIITVFATDADGDIVEASESTAISRYSSGDVSGMVLNSNVLSVGDAATPSITVSDLCNATYNYDNGDDEDVMHTCSGTTLTVDGGGSYSTEKIDILSGDTLTVSGTETLATYDLTITGNLTSGGNSTYNVAGSWDNNGTFTVSTSTVNFTAGATGMTIDAGGTEAGKTFYDVVFNNSSGGWTIQTSDMKVTHNLTITDIADSADSWTLGTGRTLEVDGTYSITSAETAYTKWEGSTFYLNGTSQTIGGKTQAKEEYATLQVGANTDIRMWNSLALTYTVDATGSLYSMDHNFSDGTLYIWGDYYAQTNDYWSYATDFDGTNISGAGRPVHVKMAPDTYVTVGSGNRIDGIGAEYNMTVVDWQYSGSDGYSITIQSGGTVNFNFTDFEHMATSDSYTGIKFLAGSSIVDGGFDNCRFNNFGFVSAQVSYIMVDSSVIGTGSTNRTFTGVKFYNSGGAASVYNILRDGTGNENGHWDFVNYSGPFSGASYESELDAYDMIHWVSSIDTPGGRESIEGSVQFEGSATFE